MAEVLFDMADKSHNDLAVITDAEARYVYEAGTDKQEELFRLVTDAVARLDIEFQRFTVDPPSVTVDGDDKQRIDGSTFITFTLHDTSRRRLSQIESVTQLVHSYIVNLTLSMFYESKVSTQQNQYGNTVAGVAERVAGTRAQEAANSLVMIEKYLYSKLRPVRSVRGTKENGITI